MLALHFLLYSQLVFLASTPNFFNRVMRKVYFFLVAMFFVSLNDVLAQSTFDEVYNLFQANCTVGCHSGSSPSANLDLSGSKSEVYDALVGVSPVNPYAANTLKQKLVYPGYANRSYLLRKVSHGLDSDIDLKNVAEGNYMPDGQPALEDYEIELIRQWIIWGAKDTGVCVDQQMLVDYYTNGGIDDIDIPPTPEEEGKEGYQMRFGPVFMQPGEEFEYIQVFESPDDVEKEIVKMDGIMHPFSHHWVMYDLDQGQDSILGAAPLDAQNIPTQAFIFLNTQYMGIWMFSREMNLPEGTAIFLDQKEQYLMNLHQANYSQDSICKASAYFNVYTQDAGSGAVEMKASLKQYGDNNPYLLVVPNDGTPQVVEQEFTVPGETYYFWTIQSHTHKLGTDYDMYLRNQDGTKGEKIYEGFYNADYTFNQGYFDYTHPPVKIWDNMFEVNMDNGMIFEATYLNNGPDTIRFGLTTEDEMYITYYQYTTELPSVGVNEIDGSGSVSVYPNPATEAVTLNFNDNTFSGQTNIEVYDMFGKLVRNVNTISYPTTRIDRGNLPAGVYVYKLVESGRVLSTGKVVFR